MMFRNAIFVLTIAILSTTFGCNQPAAETAQEETTTADTTAATVNVSAPSGEGFTTEVLQADLPSPRKQMTATMGDLKVVVNYGSPSVKGRTIGTDIATFGKVWRSGANEATTIEFSKDVTVEGKKLKAGKYGFFTIPNANEWVIIFNGVSEQWGEYDYAEGKDALRVNVKPTVLGVPVEQMAFVIENGAIVLQWSNVGVPFKVA
jgi:hypothetical protein